MACPEPSWLWKQQNQLRAPRPSYINPTASPVLAISVDSSTTQRHANKPSTGRERTPSVILHGCCAIELGAHPTITADAPKQMRGTQHMRGGGATCIIVQCGKSGGKAGTKRVLNVKEIDKRMQCRDDINRKNRMLLSLEEWGPMIRR